MDLAVSVIQTFIRRALKCSITMPSGPAARTINSFTTSLTPSCQGLPSSSELCPLQYIVYLAAGVHNDNRPFCLVPCRSMTSHPCSFANSVRSSAWRIPFAPFSILLCTFQVAMMISSFCPRSPRRLTSRAHAASSSFFAARRPARPFLHILLESSFALPFPSRLPLFLPLLYSTKVSFRSTRRPPLRQPLCLLARRFLLLSLRPPRLPRQCSDLAVFHKFSGKCHSCGKLGYLVCDCHSKF